MAGRMVNTHNRHILGLVPTLWKLLRSPKSQTGEQKIDALVLGKKYTVPKLKRGFHLNVVSASPSGLKVLARQNCDAQEV